MPGNDGELQRFGELLQIYRFDNRLTEYPWYKNRECLLDNRLP